MDDGDVVGEHWRSPEVLHPILAVRGTLRLAGEPGSLVRLELLDLNTHGGICTPNLRILSAAPLLVGLHGLLKSSGAPGRTCTDIPLFTRRVHC